MPAKRVHLLALTQWITSFALAHPHDLPQRLAERLGVGRRRALRAIDELVDAQWLVREGAQRRATFRPGLLRQTVCSYALPGLDEDLPWSRDFAPHVSLAPNVARLLQYAFTELVNNAADHSGGSTVTVSVRQTASHVQLLVSDDGCGVFDRIERAFDIHDHGHAALELSKGKLTSVPERHTGRGLFFAARVADVFELHANTAVMRSRCDEGSLPLRDAPARNGSTVFVGIALDTDRTLDDVLRSVSTDGAGYGFERTLVPLRLLTSLAAGLESRAQARRAALRLQCFRQVALDFHGMDDIGHSFADELFRVWQAQCPAVELLPLNMAPRVAALVASVRGDTA